MTFKHLIFDLDRTLWDYDTNCANALELIWNEFGTNVLQLPDLVKNLIITPNLKHFISAFKISNQEAWALYDARKINKEELRHYRFQKVLSRLNKQNDELAYVLEDAFLYECPRQNAVIEGSVSVLELLKPHYKLHILTNGFLETQTLKLKSSGLLYYFDTITTSECSPYRKPEPEIFEFTLRKIKAHAEEVLMIGDSRSSDVEGALAAGIKAVWFNRDNAETVALNQLYYTICKLEQLLDIAKIPVNSAF
jgi:putative hydrolase of the HAD superfamily